jgi:hypothetical protein
MHSWGITVKIPSLYIWEHDNPVKIKLIQGFSHSGFDVNDQYPKTVVFSDCFDYFQVYHKNNAAMTFFMLKIPIPPMVNIVQIK